MGDAAHKEPSMEDILSSIRKIVSQEDKLDDQDDTARSAAAAGQRLADLKNENARLAGNAPKTGHGGAGSLGNLAQQMRRQNPQQAPQPQPEVAEQPDVSIHAEIAPNADPGESEQPTVETPHKERDMSEAAEKKDAGNTGPDAMEESVRDDGGMGSQPDRETEAFREALVAPSTRDSVSNSFEKMKKSVLENIDARMDALMRPLLAEWLDEHLPDIVERIVREEVERLARTD